MTEVTIKLQDIDRRMHAATDVLKKEFSGLRTGRASVNLLDPVVVEAYGSRLPLSQVASVSAPDARTLSVQVWDQSMTKSVEKAITDSGLGLNPMAEGQIIRIHLPDLSEERRKELVRVAAKYAEAARISVRNVRRDGMEMLKKMEKDSEISEDDHRRYADKIQHFTDQHVKTIDISLQAKEKDILTV